MSARETPRLLTVEEYERIPDPPGGHYELHHGELVAVTYPLRSHRDIQRRLRKMLEPMLEPWGFVVDTEYPYRPLPETEVWGADVACVLSRRHESEEKWLNGSPELVIEVKSPSNTRQEMLDKAMTTLAGDGAVEFWVVDPEKRAISVYRKTQASWVYGPDERVPVLEAGSVNVSDVLRLER